MSEQFLLQEYATTDFEEVVETQKPPVQQYYLNQSFSLLGISVKYWVVLLLIFLIVMFLLYDYMSKPSKVPSGTFLLTSNKNALPFLKGGGLTSGFGELNEYTDF